LTAAGITAAGGCGGGAFSTAPQQDAAVDVGVDSGAGEAAADTASADAPGDAGADTSVQDAGSGEASPTPEASTHWCSGRPEVFCEDFDEETNVTPFLATWTTSESMGGSFAFDTSASVPSPPNALRASGSSGAQVLVLKTMPHPAGHPKSIRLGFELRVNTVSGVVPLSAAGIAAVAYGVGLSDGYVAIAVTDGPSLSAVWSAPADAGATDAGPFQIAKATGSFPALQTWAGRYTLEIDYAAAAAGGGATLQLYQGVTPLLSPPMPLPPSLGNPGFVSIALGDYAGGLQLTGTIDLEFDDATYDVAY
jgi:hypothetical protein